MIEYSPEGIYISAYRTILLTVCTPAITLYKPPGNLIVAVLNLLPFFLSSFSLSLLPLGDLPL